MFGYEMNWMMWFFGALMVAGVVIIIIVAVLAIAGRLGADHANPERFAGPSGRGPRSRARQILDERFARGELSADEYGEHLRILGEE